ncbi:MAG: ABC transporter substrate-binding protein [Lachnospiraceae bacterium]
MKKRLLFALLMILLVSALCGCGGGTEKEQSKGNETSGGSVVVGITNDMDSLDPHKAIAAGTNEVLYNIFEGLVKADSNGVMQPALCSSYVMSEDALSYTFTLREGVHFHNGDEVTAEDVIYSLKRVAGMLDENDIKIISAFSIISNIEEQSGEDGSTSIVVSLSEPNTELIYYFDCAVIPADYDKQESAPVGTGPFKFVSYSPMENIVIARNDDYYGNKAHLDQVTFKIFASTNDAFMELLAGNIDIYPYLSYDEASQLEGQYSIVQNAQSLAEGLYLNNEYEPLSNLEVRQALCYAVDFEEIDGVLTGGTSDLLKTGMFTTFKEYYNADTESAYPHDVEKAKELLKSAGYENGFDLEITVPSNYQLHVMIAEVLVTQLKEVGINATIKQVDWSTWLNDVYMGHEYQATVIALDATMAPADVLRYYQSGHRSNFVNFNHDEFDNLYQEAMSATDMDEKIAKYKECQQYLTDNAASVYLMCPSIMVAVNPELEGYTFYPIYVQDMSTIYYK